MLLLRLKARLSDIGALYHNRLYNTNTSENKGGYIGLSPETLFTPIAKARGTQALLFGGLIISQKPLCNKATKKPHLCGSAIAGSPIAAGYSACAVLRRWYARLFSAERAHFSLQYLICSRLHCTLTALGLRRSAASNSLSQLTQFLVVVVMMLSVALTNNCMPQRNSICQHARIFQPAC